MLGKSSRLPDLVCFLRKLHLDFCLPCLILSWQYNREVECPAMFSMWGKNKKTGKKKNQMEVSYASTRGCVFYKWKHKNPLLVFYFDSQHIAASHYFTVLAADSIANYEKRMRGYIRHGCFVYPWWMWPLENLARQLILSHWEVQTFCVNENLENWAIQGQRK